MPVLFASKYAGKKALQTMFVAVENGKPKMIVSTFSVTENGSLKIDELKELGAGQVYAFGETAAITKYQTGNPSWGDSDPGEIIRKFIGLEIEDQPDLVGLPLSIVRITSREWRWIEPGQCASEQSH